MMTPHDPTHDEPEEPDEPRGAHELLAGLLAGTRSATDPQLLAACADPRFQRRLDALVALQARLDRAAQAEFSALGSAPTAIDARVRAAALRGLGRRNQGLRAWPLWLALAAALLLGGGAVLLWRSAAPHDIALTSEAVLVVDPGYAAVHWQVSAGRRWHQVRIRSRDGAELERSDLLRDNTWVPTRRDLPDEVVVELWLVDSSGKDGRRLAALPVGRDGRPR